MEPISAIAPELCRRLRYLFSDIDDTMTDEGLLPASSLEAMWRLHEAGVKVVPVTGRPAGWCDHIARMWPVDAVVGENGAFYFSYDRAERRMHRVYVLPEEDRLAGLARLEEARRRVLEEVPEAAIAADQPFRLYDLAVDFAEDVGPLADAQIDRICAVLEEVGLNYKISSIHVNAWAGDYDKVGCMRLLLERDAAVSVAQAHAESVFIGDSPNDEPAFAAFSSSIGVANVRDFAPRLTTPPAYVTEARGARGFAEAVDTILARRAG
ncbi:MAG: HAD-IIB family hydrolase [Spirochaetaceae bacterium]